MIHTYEFSSASGTSLDFYFEPQRNAQNIEEFKTFLFYFIFFDCSITDAKLVLLPPEFLVISDACLEIGVHL